MGNRYLSLEERFWGRVQKADGDACWTWAGSHTGTGYGKLRAHGRIELAHRVAWELTKGASAGDLCVCHRCDNPGCVRPDHMFLGTHADNMKDAVAKGRKNESRGVDHYATALDEAAIRAIRASSESSRVIGPRFGVAASTVRSIRNRKSWQHVA
jgi:hypothetical protein